MKTPIGWGTAIALGMCVGVVFGLLLDKIAIGVALGPLFGIVIRTLRTSRSDDRQR